MLVLQFCLRLCLAVCFNIVLQCCLPVLVSCSVGLCLQVSYCLPVLFPGVVSQYCLPLLSPSIVTQNCPQAWCLRPGEPLLAPVSGSSAFCLQEPVSGSLGLCLPVLSSRMVSQQCLPALSPSVGACVRLFAPSLFLGPLSPSNVSQYCLPVLEKWEQSENKNRKLGTKWEQESKTGAKESNKVVTKSE